MNISVDEEQYDVPEPLRNGDIRSPLTISLRDLKVGQSLLVSDDSIDHKILKDRVSGPKKVLRERYNQLYTMRKISDGKFRIWRIQ